MARAIQREKLLQRQHGQRGPAVDMLSSGSLGFGLEGLGLRAMYG